MVGRVAQSESETVKGKVLAAKLKLPPRKRKSKKKRGRFHSRRCAFAEGDECQCICDGKFHGTGIVTSRRN